MITTSITVSQIYHFIYDIPDRFDAFYHNFRLTSLSGLAITMLCGNNKKDEYRLCQIHLFQDMKNKRVFFPAPNRICYKPFNQNLTLLYDCIGGRTYCLHDCLHYRKYLGHTSSKFLSVMWYT